VISLPERHEMKLLVLQETDWIKRGPHQQHHLMDRMALRGHEVHVIDYDICGRANAIGDDTGAEGTH